MSQISFLLFLLLTACGSCGAWSGPIPAEKQSHVAVRVEVTCENDLQGSASGVLVRDDLALTALHVVEDTCGGKDVKAIVVRHAGTATTAKVKRTDPEIDIALLRLSYKIGDGYHVPVGRRPELDDRVCFQPATPEGANVRACGFVVARYSRRSPGDVRIEGFAWFGNSGSGVWDEDGRLVGTLTSVHYGPNQPVFRKVDGGKLRAEGTLVRPIRGVRFTSLAGRGFY